MSAARVGHAGHGGGGSGLGSGLGPWIARARTFVVVSALAVLVWVLAESQTLQTTTVQTVFEVMGGEASDAFAARAAPGEDWNGLADISVRTPAASRGEAEQTLRDTRVRIEPGRDFPTTPGTHVVDLLDVLRRSGHLRGEGVTAVSCEPALVRVEVVRLVTFEVPVALELPEALAQSPGEVVPPKVRLTAPERSLVGLNRDALRAAARPDAGRFGSFAPGQRLSLTGVPVELPAGLEAWASRVEPETARVEVAVRSVTMEHVIDRLPVQVLVAPSETGRWSIEIPAGSRDLVNVRVRGPQGGIESIRSGAVRPVAAVRLTFDELEARIDAKDVEILGLPSGVTWEVADPTIGLRIRAADEVEG